jgi:hypothetical protein
MITTIIHRISVFIFIIIFNSPSQQRKHISITIVLTIFVSITAIAVTLTEFVHFGAAQGQEDGTTSPSSSLTPEQKTAICDPNSPTSKLNPVNTTESRICGIPKTVKPSIPNGTDTGAASPSVVPTPPPE